MPAADSTSTGAARIGGPAARGLRALAPAACLALGGCHLVPAEDVNVFLADLAPGDAREVDEAALEETIRAETHVEDFQFAEQLDTGSPRLPAVLAKVIRLVAGE